MFNTKRTQKCCHTSSQSGGVGVGLGDLCVAGCCVTGARPSRLHSSVQSCTTWPTPLEQTSCSAHESSSIKWAENIPESFG
ncbi:hypothetical protein EYF80_064205 [Liparis tanakae]|uniref:Uncharacterized protein n=1 Tax=Liparis tanakae TaxID=230148 RepID=A0A4Z2EAT8_9TELE|nr:hypothetical protein EYF80_064205 [Liparis tanakae]